MNGDEFNMKSPEEKELDKYKERYDELMSDYEKKQKSLCNVKTTLDRFETRFVKYLGRKYETIDELDYKLREFKKQRNAFNQTYDFKYDFDDIFEEVKKREEDIIVKNKETDEEKSLKEIYRDMVKEIHPDRTGNDEDEKVRTDIMAEINEAYREKDKERMMIIYNKWKNDPKSVEGEGTGDKLVRVIRNIYNLEDNIYDLEKEKRKICTSDLYMLKKEMDRLKAVGVDGMRGLSQSLDKEIAMKKKIVRFFELLKEKANYQK